MKETVEVGCEPAQIVGVGELCGELDLSVQFLHSHDVFRTFVPHFTGPEDDDTERNVCSKHKTRGNEREYCSF